MIGGCWGDTPSLYSSQALSLAHTVEVVAGFYQDALRQQRKPAVGHVFGFRCVTSEQAPAASQRITIALGLSKSLHFRRQVVGEIREKSQYSNSTAI